MSGVRERARMLQEETEKIGKSIESQQNGELLSEDDQKALEKVCHISSRRFDLKLTLYNSFSKIMTSSSNTSRSGSKTPRRSTIHGRQTSSHGQQSDERAYHVVVYDFIDDLVISFWRKSSIATYHGGHA